MFEKDMVDGGRDEVLDNIEKFGFTLPTLSKSILNIPGRDISEESSNLFSEKFPKTDIFRKEGKVRAMII